MSGTGYIIELVQRGDRQHPIRLHPGERITVGRGSESDVVIDDPLLSRRHLALDVAATGCLRAIDMESKNRTLLNGEPLVECQLSDGDVLSAGDCQLFVRCPPAGAGRVQTVPSSSFARDSVLSVSAQTLEAFREDRPQGSARQLRGLYELAERLVRASTIEAVYRGIERTLDTGFEYDRFLIGYLDPNGQEFEVLRATHAKDGEPILLSQTILEHVRGQSQAMLVSNSSTAPRHRVLTEPTDSVRSLGITSFMSTPLPAANSQPGVLYVDRVDLEQPFEPCDLEFLCAIARIASLAIEEVSLRNHLEQDNARLRKILTRKHEFVAESPPMLDVLRKAERLADSESPVLVLGATGTGKEHVARLIHDRSPRADGPFVAFNCALSTAPLVDSELFGHVRGAFTGAERDHAGRFQLAHGGTLFLDEVGELPLETQAKLLRVLQEAMVWPVGAEEGVATNIRLICATHRNLKQMRRAGRFRDDLYYRIGVLSVELPPLSKRGDDVIAIARSQLPDGLTLADDAIAALRAYRWPGNVRELNNVLEQARFNCTQAVIRLQDLPEEVAREGRRRAVEIRPVSLEELEAKHIARTIADFRGNKTRAAEALGISRETLYQKIRLYGL